MDVDFDGIICLRFCRQINLNRDQSCWFENSSRGLFTAKLIEPAAQQISIHAMRQGDRRDRNTGLAKRHQFAFEFSRVLPPNADH